LLHGIELVTQDLIEPAQAEFILFNEMPLNSTLNQYRSIVKHVLLLETVAIRPLNWNLKLHAKVDLIFTWNNQIIDNRKYFKINFPNLLLPQPFRKFYERKSFCCMIAGNKNSNFHLELYSERLRAIKWFEVHQPESFSLFGFGWNHFLLPSEFLWTNKIPGFGKILSKFLRYFVNPGIYPSYKGVVVSKFETYSNFKFCICYENIKDTPGYITEKIFDAFLAGCIPVYLGDKEENLPFDSDTYVSKRDFNSYEELYDFLVNISEAEYNIYHQNILKFLSSNQSNLFGIDYFSSQIVNRIISYKKALKNE